MTNKTLAISLAAALAASCSTNNHMGGLTITKVLSGKRDPAPANTCTVSAADKEFDIMAINPAETAGHLSLVVKNELIDPTTINTQFRTNTATFTAHQAVITYEVIGGASSIPQQISPASGTSATASESPVGAYLDPNRQFTTLAAGTFVRAYIRLEGTLGSGVSARTSVREYLFEICSTSGCSTGCL